MAVVVVVGGGSGYLVKGAKARGVWRGVLKGGEGIVV